MDLETIFGPSSNFICSETSTEKAFADFSKVILKTASKWIPRGKQLKFKPFWNENLASLKDISSKSRKTAEQTKDPEDVQKWRRNVAILRREILVAKRKCFNDFINDIDYRKDGKKVYGFINRVNDEDRDRKKEPMKVGSRFLTDDRKISGAFNTFYAKRQRLRNELKKSQRTLKKKLFADSSSNDDGPSVFNDNFTIPELREAIGQMKSKKSPGPDNIHVEFLKNLGPNSLHVLLNLYNKSWNSTVPADWKKAILIPILKKKKPQHELDSYRPIALTSILSKIMERMIVSRLNWYLESNSLLSPKQAGFRKHHSTSQQVILLSQSIKDALDKRKSVLAVFVDFKAAYDNVWRLKTVEKLQSLGVRGRMFHWIKKFLSQRFCATRYGTCTSKYKQVETGLPQGTVLSPILFNIFINDLLDSLAPPDGQLDVALFADDLVFWNKANKKDQDDLNRTLNLALQRLEEWCFKNNMRVNLDKTMCQFFSLNRQPFVPELFYEGSLLKQTDSATYLGCKLDNRLNWRKHAEHVIDRARRRLPILKRLSGIRWGCGRETLNITYKMFIQPILNYCCEIMVSAPKGVLQCLDTFQNQALRIVTGAIKSTPTLALQLMTNTQPMINLIQRNAFLLSQKLIRLPNNTYWKNYDLTQKRNLKTQNGFIQCVTRLDQYREIEKLKPAPMTFSNPLDYILLDVRLDLEMRVSKKDMSPEQVKAITLETIEQRFPAEDWLHVYTDGSLTDREQGAGAGIYSKLFCFYLPVGIYSTHFDGELKAISVALQQLSQRQNSFGKAVILSDSISALQAISNNQECKSPFVQECRDVAKELSHRISFQWVPSHCGVQGNEMADLLAKKGAAVLQKPSMNMSYYSIKLLTSLVYRQSFKDFTSHASAGKSWSVLSTDPTVVPDLPRTVAVASFRLLTGHDCLRAHLFRIGVVDSPLCILCDSGRPMTADHLDECQALVNFSCRVDKYWQARSLMA